MSYGPIYLWNLLYQAKTEPVSTQPETVTESRWHEPYSEPVRRKGLAVALIAASGLISPVIQPPVAVAGVQFDAATVQSGTSTGSGTSFSDSSLTIAANSNRALVVAMSMLDDPGSVAALDVKWNGVSMTRIITKEDTTSGNSASILFGMLNPATGNHALTGTWTNNLPFAVAGISLYNVDTSSFANAFQNATSANLTTSPITITVTSNVGDKVVAIQSADFCTLTPTGPHVVFNYHDVSGYSGAAQWHDGASPSVTSQATESVNQTWTAVGVTVRPPPTSADNGVGWVNTNEWIQPVRQKVVTRSEQQSVDTDPVVSFGWSRTISDPTRRKYDPSPYQDYADWVAVAVNTNWFNPLSEPVRGRPVTRSEQPSWSLFTAPVTVSTGWISQLSEPVWPKKGLGAPYRIRYNSPSVTKRMSWFEGLSEPVRGRPVTRSEQPSWSQFTTPEVVNTGWYGNLSEPVWPKKNLGAPYRIRHSSPIVAKRMSWFEALSEPTRRIPTATRYEQQSWSLFPTPVVITTNWFNPLSEPTRIKGLHASQQRPNFPFSAVARRVSWFEPLAEPVRKRPTPTLSENQPWYLFSAPTVVNNGWFASLSEPVWPKKGLGARYGVRYPFIASTLRMSWFEALSEPTRRIPTATRYEQQSWSLLTPLEVLTTVWFYSLSEPSRRIKPTPTDQQAYPFFPQPNVVITGWYNWLSDPTRPRLDPAPYQDYADWVAVTPETITTNWFNSLSEPVRRIGIKTALEPYFSFWPIPISATYGWFTDLSVPTRRVGMRTELQHSFSLPPFPVTASFNWFATLSEPTRRVPVATRYEQPSWSLFIEPTFVFLNWYRQFNDPTRRIPQAPNPATTFTAIPPPPAYGWYAPWREPTPPMKRTSFFTPFTFAPTPPIIPSFGWYGSLSIPVRIKPKVWEGIYEGRPAAVIIINHLMQMAATESHDFFLGVLYAFNPPLRAYVDIITKDPKYRGNMGIIENAPEPSIIASIVPQRTISATGIVVTGPVRARVAIIVS